MGVTMIRSALPGAITFLFIFGWKITELADLILLTSLALIAFSFFRGHVIADRVSLRVTAVLGVLSIYSLLIVLVNGLLDTQIALRSLRALINFLGALSLTGIYFARSRDGFFGLIVRDIYLALVAHAGLMLAMFFSGTCRRMIYQLTSAADYVNLSSPFLDGFRITGLTYGLSQTSVLQLIGLLLLPLVLESCPRPWFRLFLLAGAPLLFLSILISGRSGLMLGLLFLPVVAVGQIFAARNSAPTRIIARLAGTVCLVTLLLASLYAVSGLLPQKFVAYSLPQAGEVFAALQLDGPTIANISEMFVMPGSWTAMFFGSSNLGRGSLENIPSDIGWIKTMFAIGLTGTLLTLAPYLFALRAAWQARLNAPFTSIVVTLIFLSALILNCKELALLTRNQWSVHALLLTALCLQMHLDARPPASSTHAVS